MIKKFILSICLISTVYANDVEKAKQLAKFHLSAYECDNAVLALSSVPFQKNDSEYISLYADTYLCKASGLKSDLTQIDSIEFFSSLASLNTSTEIKPDSFEYKNGNSAFQTLIKFDGTGFPDTKSRLQKFGVKKGTELSIKVLEIALNQFGKFLALYGNASLRGEKGKGRFQNSCLFSYTQTDAMGYVNSTQPTTCLSATGSEGSKFLMAPNKPEVIKRRLCEGITYYNNILDILSHIDLSIIWYMGEISKVLTVQEILLTAAQTLEYASYNTGSRDSLDAIASIKGMTGEKECLNTPISQIEKWYAIFFETIF